MFGWTNSINTYPIIISRLIYPRKSPSLIVFTSIMLNSSPTLHPLDLVGLALLSSTAEQAPLPGERCGWCMPPSSLSLSQCTPHFDFLIVLAQVYSRLEFDLTLGVIPSEYVASSCSANFYTLYSVLLVSRKLIGS
jgi:hypothetical protein